MLWNLQWRNLHYVPCELLQHILKISFCYLVCQKKKKVLRMVIHIALMAPIMLYKQIKSGTPCLNLDWMNNAKER